MKIQADTNANKRSRNSFQSLALGAMIGMGIGFFMGRLGAQPRNDPYLSKSKQQQQQSTSFVSHVDQLPLQPTSHAGAYKQVLLSFGSLADNFAGLSRARIEPGQSIEWHHHPTMFECFYVLSGEGYVAMTTQQTSRDDPAQLNARAVTSQLTKGSFLLTAPGDYHSFRVDQDKTEPLQLLYFGVTTDSN